jgi:hypothetical protein
MSTYVDHDGTDVLGLKQDKMIYLALYTGATLAGLLGLLFLYCGTKCCCCCCKMCFQKEVEIEITAEQWEVIKKNK